MRRVLWGAIFAFSAVLMAVGMVMAVVAPNGFPGVLLFVTGAFCGLGWLERDA